MGEERVKRGAYLAGLAEGPSVAQDLGLEPKDRLISVEGEDVKSLGFDRIGELPHPPQRSLLDVVHLPASA